MLTPLSLSTEKWIMHFTIKSNINVYLIVKLDSRAHKEDNILKYIAT
jgi:hypothetical protein